MSPDLPEVSGSVSAKAAKNAQPAQSEIDRSCLTLGAAREVALMCAASTSAKGRYWTRAIEPVIGVGFVLNCPLLAIELKKPRT